MNKSELIKALKEIRSNPRKMQQSYLEKIGVYSIISDLVPNDFKIKEKIDIIILDEYTKCKTCQKEFAKIPSVWCSHSCKNKDIDFRAYIGKTNRENKISRSKALKETLQKKYGVSAVQNIPSVKAEARNKKLNYYLKLEQETFAKYGLDIEKFKDEDFLKQICINSSYKELSKNHFGKMPVMTIFRFFNRIGFDPGFELSQSKGEREISMFIKSLNVEYKTNDRTIISPLELDIVMEDYKLAIEFNGLYYHSGLHKDYHINKTQLCKEKDYKLIHIFEDEWEFKSDLVKSIIKSKLNIYDKKYFARKLIFCEIDKLEAKEFLENNHIQGSINGTHYGLKSKSNELISMITVGKSRFSKNELELYRYCSLMNVQVIGGFSKLISNYKKISNQKSILTFADLRYSTGDVYIKNNGILLRQTEPNYWWVKNNLNRISRHQTQKHKLIKLLGEKFDVSLSESENMKKSGYEKIYDCGNLLFRI